MNLPARCGTGPWRLLWRIVLREVRSKPAETLAVAVWRLGRGLGKALSLATPLVPVLPFTSLPSWRTLLLEMVYLGNVLRGMGELEADPPAMPASRNAVAFESVTSCGMSAWIGL